MKKQGISRFIIMILILTMILPSFAFAEEEGRDSLELKTAEKILETRDLIDLKSEDLEDLFEIKDEEEVRVIVELESEPVINLASDYGRLSSRKKDNLESKIKNEQASIKSKISKNINISYEKDFETVFNGFSALVKYGDIGDIENSRGVKKVHIAETYYRPIVTPDMGTSTGLVEAPGIWSDYDGEGRVIAVIDSGFDENHPDFKLTNEENARLEKSDIIALGFDEKTYRNSKFPYIYNYFDKNHSGLDLGKKASYHGMHVAGTVAANGKIKGVAPEAQVLGMKVFSNDPGFDSTSSDIYIDAINDAVKLGVDSINMSLGAVAGFNQVDGPLNTAIDNAMKKGIVVAVSAGNSNYSNYGYTDKDIIRQHRLPFKEDPDYGLVGSPSLLKNTLSVASVENTHGYFSHIQIGSEDEKIYIGDSINFSSQLPYKSFIDIHGNKELEFVDCGMGISDYARKEDFTEEVDLDQDGFAVDKEGNKLSIPNTGDFKGIDLEGKVALIARGEVNFSEKTIAAYENNAIGVIIYDTEGKLPGLTPVRSDLIDSMPVAGISKADGERLLKLEDKKFKVPESSYTENKDSMKMSEFSSWGVTPDLKLKPEITAPGGNIYSTLQNDSYGNMNGTSMASPHVAAGAALVKQYIDGDQRFKGYTESRKANLNKLLLMNTALPVIDRERETNLPYSPRKQGAGMMQLNAATKTPVVVYSKGLEKVGKLELGEIKGENIRLELVAENLTDKEVNYRVLTDLLADEIVEIGGEEFIAMYTRAMDGSISGAKSISVPANGTRNFEINIDFSKDQKKYENMFVEGFVRLIDEKGENPNLSIPYVGFYGDWKAPNILDRDIISGKSYYGRAGFNSIVEVVGEDGSRNSKLAPYGKEAYLSPGETGERFGNNFIFPILSFMRNTSSIKASILDEDGKHLRNLGTNNYIRKNFGNGKGSDLPTQRIFNNFLWDGSYRGRTVADGKYIYRMEAKLAYENEEAQIYDYPIYIDTRPPEISNLEYDESTGILSWDGRDETTGLVMQSIYISAYGLDQPIHEELIGSLMREDYKTEGKVFEVYEDGKESFSINLKDIEELRELYEKEIDFRLDISAVDQAYNMGVGTIYIEPFNYFTGSDIPEVHLVSPGLMENIGQSKDVVFRGVVRQDFQSRMTLSEAKKDIYIPKVAIGDRTVELEFNERTIVKNPDGRVDIFPGYDFEYKIDLADGFNELMVHAKAYDGTENQYRRYFLVDSQAPELEIELAETVDGPEAEINFTMSDNSSLLRLNLFDEEIYIHDGNQDGGFEENAIATGKISYSHIVDRLELGENILEFSLVDIAGNKTEKTVSIKRVEELSEDDLKDLDKYIEEKLAEMKDKDYRTQKGILDQIDQLLEKYGDEISEELRAQIDDTRLDFQVEEVRYLIDNLKEIEDIGLEDKEDVEMVYKKFHQLTKEQKNKLCDGSIFCQYEVKLVATRNRIKAIERELKNISREIKRMEERLEKGEDILKLGEDILEYIRRPIKDAGIENVKEEDLEKFDKIASQYIEASILAFDSFEKSVEEADYVIKKLDLAFNTRVYALTSYLLGLETEVTEPVIEKCISIYTRELNYLIDNIEEISGEMENPYARYYFSQDIAYEEEKAIISKIDSKRVQSLVEYAKNVIEVEALEEMGKIYEKYPGEVQEANEILLTLQELEIEDLYDFYTEVEAKSIIEKYEKYPREVKYVLELEMDKLEIIYIIAGRNLDTGDIELELEENLEVQEVQSEIELREKGEDLKEETLVEQLSQSVRQIFYMGKSA